MRTIPLRPVYTANGGMVWESLGTTADFINTTANIANTANQAASVANEVIPTSAYQSDLSKVSNKIATIAGSVAAVAAVIPGVGTVVSVVAGAIAAVAALVGVLFKNSAAKKLAAERGQYEAMNAQLIMENAELDTKIATLKRAIDDAAVALGIEYSSMNGLGFCIFNCKKKSEEKKLDRTKTLYKELIKEQEDKILLAQQLAETAEKLFVAKQNRDTGLYIAGGIGLLAVAWIVYKKFF